MRDVFHNILLGLFDFLSATVCLLFVITGLIDIPNTQGFEAVFLFVTSLFFGGLFFLVIHTMGKARKAVTKNDL